MAWGGPCHVESRMVLAAITDRKTLGGDLLVFIQRAAESGVDWIQIREKDLTGRELWELCRRARELPRLNNTKLLLNGRLDIAMAAGLDGVHLPAASLPAAKARELAGEDFLVGVSCHSLAELKQAEEEGASYAFFSPVFPSSSKPGYGPAKGVAALRIACESVNIPVLALGGVSIENAGACLDVAAGVAGISLFQQASDLAGLVAGLRNSR